MVGKLKKISGSRQHHLPGPTIANNHAGDHISTQKISTRPVKLFMTRIIMNTHRNFIYKEKTEPIWEP